MVVEGEEDKMRVENIQHSIFNNQLETPAKGFLLWEHG
jgi:hypothetical protein